MTEAAIDKNIAILFVPGIRAKPPAIVQAEQLQRCIRVGVALAGGTEDEARRLCQAFDLIGWSYGFYGVHADVSEDLQGIERLVSASGDPDQDRAEALSPSRRMTAAMYAAGDYFPLFGSLFATRRMETRVKEIRRYFKGRQDEGTIIRRMLAGRLQQAWHEGKRVLLIGHSFGSVIAYDTLWELTQEMPDKSGRVDMFLSMGSPLTLHYIRRRLKGAHRKGSARYPANIRRWVNLAAVGEVTALDRKLSDYFAPMVELGLTESIEDDLKLVNQFRGVDGLNVHKCYGYLASRRGGENLLSWLRDAPE
jgi:hypothetical protein